jgi:hypothetical protein
MGACCSAWIQGPGPHPHLNDTNLLTVYSHRYLDTLLTSQTHLWFWATATTVSQLTLYFLTPTPGSCEHQEAEKRAAD